MKGDFLFEAISAENKRNIFNATPLSHDFWSEFEFIELSQNMRQKEDPIFAESLSRIRVGCPTTNDIKLLSERIIKTEPNLTKIDNAVAEYLILKKKHPNLMCLFALNDDTDKFNKAISTKFNINNVKISAIDSNKTTKFTKKPNTTCTTNSRQKIKISDTAGLESTLEVGVGSVVMLRRNVDTEIGLVNGAVGSVIEIKYDTTNKDFVNQIIVKFDNISDPISIERYTADYELGRNNYITRSQFPLTLAWAITVHKSQGLSLNAVMIDLGESIFEAGMAYVALSRARLLKHVYLIEFVPTALYCSVTAFKEYARLFALSKTINNLPMFSNILPASVDVSKCQRLNNKIRKTTEMPNSKNVSGSFLDRQPTVQYITNTQVVGYPMKFANNLDNSCYANVICQALVNLGDLICNRINKNNVTTNEQNFATIFNQIYNSLFAPQTILSSWQMRLYAMTLVEQPSTNNFINKSQQDAFLFLMTLVKGFNEATLGLFRFTNVNQKVCQICNKKRVYLEKNAFHISFTPSLKYNDLNHIFKKIIEEECTFCNRVTEHKEDISLDNVDNNKYIILYIHNFDWQITTATQNTRNIKIEKPDEIIIPSTGPIGYLKYKINSIIVRTGINIDNGHYKIWCRNIKNQGWHRISDTVVTNFKSCFKTMANMQIIFLEQN